MQANLSYMKIFTVMLSVCYILGLIGVFYSCKITIAIILTLFLSIIILFFNFNFKKSVILFLIFVLGVIRAENSLNIDETLKNINSDNAILKGRIISSKNISSKNNKVKFYLKVSEADFLDKDKENREFKNLNSKVLINSNYIKSFEEKIKIGDYVEIKGKFTVPRSPRNPHEFNYKKYLSNNDCLNILYANPNSFKVIEVPNFSFKKPSESWYFILKEFENTRNKIIEKHSKNISSPRLEILGGIVFGDETVNPDEKIKEDFKNSGLLHLLAASGLNVALIFGIWWYISGLIKIPYNFSILAGGIFVILYTFMTGFPPSILRASIMLLFVLFGKIIDRSVSSIALIFFAGFLILLFSPKMIFDIGFQLSFIVTLGLVVCCPVIVSKFEKIENNYKEKHKNLKGAKRYFYYMFSPVNLISVIIVPVVAQLWVIPLQMHYFNNFAPYSVIANIMVVPFIGILSFIGFISSIAALIPYLNTPVVFIFDIIANPLLCLLIKISAIFGSLKFSIISTSGLTVLQIFGFWTILLIFTLNLKYGFKNKKGLFVLVSVVLIFFLSFIKPNCFSKNLEINMFDTQNADCILIKTPNNKYIMLDCGKYSKNGFSSFETIINKYLQNERIQKFKFLIITNDSRNNSSAIDILENIKVEKTIIKSGKQNYDILNYIKENKLKYQIAKTETIYSEDNFEIQTINLKNSTAVFIKYYDKSLLYTSDDKKDDLKEIKKYLPSKIYILKSGKYILDTLKPSYILISSDTKENENTKSLMYQNDIKVLNSKDYGFIKIVLNNNQSLFYNFQEANGKLGTINFYNNKDFQNGNYIEEFSKNNQ